MMELVTPESMVVFNKLDLLDNGEQGSSPQGLPELPRGVQTSSSWGLSCVTHAGLTEFLAGLGSRVEAWCVRSVNTLPAVSNCSLIGDTCLSYVQRDCRPGQK